MDNLIQLYESGLTCNQISDRTGIPTTSVWRKLKSAGVSMLSSGARHKGETWSPARRAHHPVKAPVDFVAQRLAKSTERFWSLIGDKNADGCQEWQGHVHNSGYGRYGFLGRKVLTHRLVWELTHGEIPKCDSHYGTLVVCHECDNRKCCNPDHLFLGTQADNIADMDHKGRRNVVPPMTRGERIGSAKLSDAAVIEIRRLRSQGITTVELAQRYSVHHSVISRAATGKTWTHL